MLVTSFSQKGYHEYGKRFIETFLENWADEQLLVYYERGVPSDAPGMDDTTGRIQYRNLYDNPDFVKFESLIGQSNPLFRGICFHPKSAEPLYNFRFDVNRFYRKVYAVTHAYENRAASDKRIAWLDADIVFEKQVPENFLEQLAPDGCAIAHLNREWLYTEAGCVVFNTENPTLETFMLLYRSAYFNGAFRYLGEMHDCYVLDFLIRLLNLPVQNLTVNEMSNHPFQESVLGQYMTHLKGPERKKTGALLSTDPTEVLA